MANEKNAKEADSVTANEKKSQALIDSVCAKKQESYDQFMNSFTVLKKEDVLAQLLKDTSDGLMREPQQQEATHDGSHTGETIVRNKVSEKHEDDIETEILIDGPCSGSVMGPKRPVDKQIVQFDNFVEDEEDSDDDADMDGVREKYVASFCPQNNKSTLDSVNLDEKSEIARTPAGLKPLPGEVDDEECGSHPPVHTIQLDLSSRLQPALENHLQHNKITNDDVVPFSLDKEFDYNNVVLTPKWTSGHRLPSFPNAS